MQDFSDQRQFRALFEFATEGIIVSDTEGVIQIANPAAEKLFGYEKGQLTGKKVEVLIPKRYAHNHGALREGFNDNPHAKSMGTGRDLFGIAQNGREFPVEISLSPYSTEKGSFIIAFIIDITIRKRNEEAIIKHKAQLESLALELDKRVKDRTMILEEALQQLEKSRIELNETIGKEKELNEMKSRFVSMASHEIRTPLTTILSSLSLVEKYSQNDNKEKQQLHIRRIKSSIANLTDLLDDVLSVTRLEEGRVMIIPEEMNIDLFMQDLVKELKQMAGEKQEIRYVHTGKTRVRFDRKVLRIICMNLVTNAIKFSGELSVMSIGLFASDDQISLTVEDNGIGISAEDSQHLFERFFRGKNVSNIPGTGLGLNIVSRYVELMGGEISVKSELNKGTKFTVIIPNHTPDEKESITD